MAEADELIRRLEQGTQPLPDRILIAERIGELGDPRTEEWSLVPGGSFLMGTDPEGEPDQKAHESPRIEPDVSTFEVMRTPVTVAQLTRFIGDGGYARRELWSDDGWAWKTEVAVGFPRFFS